MGRGGYKERVATHSFSATSLDKSPAGAQERRRIQNRNAQRAFRQREAIRAAAVSESTTFVESSIPNLRKKQSSPTTDTSQAAGFHTLDFHLAAAADGEESKQDVATAASSDEGEPLVTWSGDLLDGLIPGMPPLECSPWLSDMPELTLQPTPLTDIDMTHGSEGDRFSVSHAPCQYEALSISTSNDHAIVPLPAAETRQRDFHWLSKPSRPHNESNAVKSLSQLGRSPLHMTVMHDFANICYLLLERGANVDAREENGRTALHLAALLGRLKHATMLLRAGASIDALDKSGMTPLFLAVSNGHEDTAQLLLDSGANCNCQVPSSA